MPLANPHATLVKFGYPETLIHEGDHWALLVRPAQPTLGSLVLCATGEAEAYGDLPAEAFAEQGALIPHIERLLKAVCSYQRINYLMLMMVDPHVHFHIIPRYEGKRRLDDISYPDSGWPGPPDLASSRPASPAIIRSIVHEWQHQE